MMSMTVSTIGYVRKRPHIIIGVLATLLMGGLVFVGRGSASPSASPAPALVRHARRLPADWILEGRVYEGTVGDESSPLSGVAVSLYGAGNPYPELGTLITTTTTNAEGWYGFTVPRDSGAEFYHIVEANPEGYVSAGATAVSGTVRTDDWIEFTIPLEGQDLSSNKFWDEPLVVEWTFQGRVFEGPVGDEAVPLPGVPISLYGANNPYPDPGGLIVSTTTNAEGWYGLVVTGGSAEYYHIVQTNLEGYTSTGATSVDGTVRTDDWIEFIIPLEGQDLSGNKFWDQSAAPGLGPDLQITDFWPDGETICYQVLNAGDEVAPAGHQTGLFVDGTLMTLSPFHLVEVDLGAGERADGCFGGVWTCSSPGDDLAVVADYYEAVAESDEANNIREEFWDCDIVPPEIISGPTVLETTQTTALIAWETNEATDALVRYGDVAREFPMATGDPALLTFHLVTLTDLEPSKTYHFVAQSGDVSGNTVSSRDLTFNTLPQPDDSDPSVSILDPGVLTETALISATASDNVGVAKVVFLVDGDPVFTDYSSPYTFLFDTTAYANGDHDLSAWVEDLAGRGGEDSAPAGIANFKDATDPTVTITAPQDGASVSGKVSVTVSLSDDTGIVSARFYVDGDYRQFEPFDVSNPPTSASVTFVWDTRGEQNNTQYRLAVEVFDKDGKYGVDYVDVIVNNVAPAPPPSPPWLEVTGHTVLRNENVFAILISVKNSGDEAATNVKIWDGLQGFQPIEQKSTSVDYLPEYNPIGGWAYADIRPKSDILAGESRLFAYYAVPYMLSPNPQTPAIGDFVDLYWDSATHTGYHDYVTMPVAKTVAGDTIPQAHAKALKTANYLIVTNPYRLFALYNPTYYQGPSILRTQCNQLLSSMAELAALKKGVLGYNTTYNSESLRDLIKAGGTWSGKLASGWTSNGYMLIVGETPVVSAWWRYYGTQYTTKGDRSFITAFTDYPYASTYGDELRPELSIGRIIGNNAYYLRRPIQTSIDVYRGKTGYGFDGLQKFVVSGFPQCLSGKCDNINFKAEVDNVVKKLSGTVTGMHTPNAVVYDSKGKVDASATVNAIRTTFFANTPGKDIVFLAGHGNIVSWDTITINNVHAQATPFGSTNPFVFASSCSTARYPFGTSLAEAFLNRWAAAYMGAIEVGACGSTCPNADVFFSKWNTNTPFALALKKTKNAIGSGFLDRYWAGIYHVFGDAKFGTLGAATKVAQALPAAPTGLVTIEVPAYEVTQIDGVDAVQIPGGLLPLVAGKPAVPVYQVFYEYPSGTQVQDVVLVDRSEPQIAHGLNIPTTTIALASGEILLPALPGDDSEWWPEPEEDLEWHVFESPQTTTLAVSLYPFYYNAQTRDALFYQHYTLTIAATESPVEVTQLDTDEAVYEPAARVVVDLALENAGPDPLDVVVRATVQEAASGEFVGGLLLESLRGLAGKASYATWWESAGHDPGDYAVLVELLDPEGTLLDRRMETFRVGNRAGQVLDLSVAPDTFDPGQAVNLGLDFFNAGGVPISATVVIQIQDDTGGDIWTFEAGTPELPPGEAAHVEQTWDTAGIDPGDYQVLGYARFDGTATDLLTATVTARGGGWMVYLPLVMRDVSTP